MSSGLEDGKCALDGLADASAPCEGGWWLGRGGNIGSSTARVVGAGIGGSIGSSAARVTGDVRRCTFGGKFASETVVVGGAIDARMIGSGGAAHPQSMGRSLLTRSTLPS